MNPMLDIEIELKVYAKNRTELINPYLSLREVQCKCSYPDCNRVLINRRTAESFYLLREYFGSPIFINSGYRCQRHNADIKGSVNSYHVIGCALDIRPSDPLEFDKLLQLAEKYYDVVISYKAQGFIHVHQMG
jgi:hypothetical protein